MHTERRKEEMLHQLGRKLAPSPVPDDDAIVATERQGATPALEIGLAFLAAVHQALTMPTGDASSRR